jgi:hypothetical protein
MTTQTYQNTSQPLRNEITSLIDLVAENSQQDRTLFDAQIISSLQELKARVTKLENKIRD